MGRYFYYCLHPFSLMEMNKNPNRKDLKTLLQFGGFPSLFSLSHKKDFDAGRTVEINRWYTMI